jgi:hypothetical protein
MSPGPDLPPGSPRVSLPATGADGSGVRPTPSVPSNGRCLAEAGRQDWSGAARMGKPFLIVLTVPNTVCACFSLHGSTVDPAVSAVR